MKRTMKKHLISLAAIGMMAAMAVSCIININGNGSTWVGEYTEEGIDHTEIREVGHFRALSSSLPANVYYVQADKQEVRVETTEELAPKVLTTVEDEILTLKLEPGRYPKLILRVVVSSPDIEKLSVSGSGNLFHEGVLHASGSLALKVSGSGDILTGEIDSRDFTAQCSGSGSIRVGWPATTSTARSADRETCGWAVSPAMISKPASAGPVISLWTSLSRQAALRSGFPAAGTSAWVR